MGRVWRARDTVLHRDVAVKEIVSLSGLTTEERQELRDRSMREARAIARLNHANVVGVFDVVSTGGEPWIVMEYVPSRSLQDVLSVDGPVNPQHAARIGLGILGALRAAHGVGVLHRDVKPANVLLADGSRVVLTDFGLATVPGYPTVTRRGLLLGSPAYIPPERALNGTATPAGDLWSLGATLYAAVEGRSPYARESPMATLAALAAEALPPPRQAGTLKPVITGLLRKDPDERITAAEAEEMLLHAADDNAALAPSTSEPCQHPPAPARAVPNLPAQPPPGPPSPPTQPDAAAAPVPASTAATPARGDDPIALAIAVAGAPQQTRPAAGSRPLLWALLAAAVTVGLLLAVLLTGHNPLPHRGAELVPSPTASGPTTPPARSASPLAGSARPGGSTTDDELERTDPRGTGHADTGTPASPTATGAPAAAQPAAANVSACGSTAKAVNNSHGRLEVSACIRRTAGRYYSWGRYQCYRTSTFTPQPCNIGATQDLRYNATKVRSSDVGGIGLDSGQESLFELSGSPAGCTTAWIQTQVTNISVRFTDGYLWQSSTIPKSDVIAGSQRC
jgi:hypothetical protein